MERTGPSETSRGGNPEPYDGKGLRGGARFLRLGNRTMLVNACEIRYENGKKKMLLTITDITKQRLVESDLKKLVEQKNVLLKEMRHRIANSLQLIASILLLKAGSVANDEARFHLEDAHERIMSIATVQGQLDPAGIDGHVEVGPYLTALCKSLEKSMIGGRKPITLKVVAGAGSVTSEEAISFGLLTTELIINCLKYAFPRREGGILVSYYATGGGSEWTLSVADNGVGYEKDDASSQQGLGTSIVASLAHQLKAEVRRESTPSGTTVSLLYPDARLFV